MATKLMILATFMVATTANDYYKPMENPDLYQGDIAGEEDTPDRNAIPTMTRRWPNGIIPYQFDAAVRPIVPLIEKAMNHIEDHTCISFEPYNGTQENYVRIFFGKGCYSYWGKTGGQQPLSLGNGCQYLGTIIHELVHAIGFQHEQNRSDRDDYLIIYWDNMAEGTQDQFRKLKPHQNWLMNAFDYSSIMHYGEKAYSKDGYSKTMVAKDPDVTIIDPATRDSLSPSDIDRINILYECPSLDN